MFRRNFLQRLTFASASTLAVAAAESDRNRTVTYSVKGFTCVTCAVGLETMLGRQQGITRAEASYPKHNVVIEFNPHTVSEKTLKQYIAELGFTVEEKPAR